VEKETKSIREQACGIEEDCERAAIRASLISARWDFHNLWLGVASAVAAAIVALVASENSDRNHFGFLQPYTGALAAGSAVLTSILTFLSPSKKAETFHASANKYRELRERLRMFIHKDKQETGPDRVALEKFAQEKHEIDAGHPIVPEWAYDKAQDRIVRKMERKKDLELLRAKLQTRDRLSAHQFERRWLMRLDRWIFG
jgi:hypothetical protein